MINPTIMWIENLIFAVTGCYVLASLAVEVLITRLALVSRAGGEPPGKGPAWQLVGTRAGVQTTGAGILAHHDGGGGPPGAE